MDSADKTFDVCVRRQFRFGHLKIAVDPVGFGYQPKAILHLQPSAMRLDRVNARGEPIQGSFIFPSSWTWTWDQVVSGQIFFVTFTGWGLDRPGRHGLRLDVHGESFYPLLVTNALDPLVEALKGHGVPVDRKPRRLNWFLTGRK